MKTPIQELFEFMEQNQYFIGNELFNKYQELLKKEKEVITEAYIEGCNDNILCESTDKRRAKEYYNNTFNTKEK